MHLTNRPADKTREPFGRSPRHVETAVPLTDIIKNLRRLWTKLCWVDKPNNTLDLLSKIPLIFGGESWNPWPLSPKFFFGRQI
jgi:hypothetical protein